MSRKQGATVVGLMLPAPWPPLEPLPLSCLDLDGTSVEILGDSHGRLGALIRYPDDDRHLHWFQRVLISGLGTSFITLVWNENKADMYFNGEPLAADPAGEGPVCFVEIRNGPTDLPKPIYGNMRAIAGVSDAEQFLLDTVKDIEAKLSTDRTYDLIRATGLLRQLLIDANPLVHLVNRERKLRMRFTVIPFDDQMPLFEDLAFYWHGLDPSFAPKVATVELDIDAFLKMRVLKTDSITASVKDLIKTFANAKGGVHYGEADSAAQETILDWDGKLLAFGSPVSKMAIIGLCRVILTGLQPLIATFSRAT